MVCAKVFNALTDKGTDARGIRRPLPLKELCEIAGATQEETSYVFVGINVAQHRRQIGPSADCRDRGNFSAGVCESGGHRVS
jgi:hypothetical protein